MVVSVALVAVLLFSVAVSSVVMVRRLHLPNFATQVVDALVSWLSLVVVLVSFQNCLTQVVGSLSWLSLEAVSRQRLDLVGDSLALVLSLRPHLEVSILP